MRHPGSFDGNFINDTKRRAISKSGDKSLGAFKKILQGTENKELRAVTRRDLGKRSQKKKSLSYAIHFTGI